MEPMENQKVTALCQQPKQRSTTLMEMRPASKLQQQRWKMTEKFRLTRFTHHKNFAQNNFVHEISTNL